MKGSTLWQGLEVLMRGRRLFVIGFTSVLTATFLYLVLAPRVFESTSTIIVEPSANVAKSVVGLEVVSGGSNIPVEVEVLRSFDLAQRVAEELLRLEQFSTDEGDKVKSFALLKKTAGAADREKAITTELSRNLSVQQLRRDIGIIKIAYRSRDREEATFISNLYATEYAERNIEVSRQKAAGVRAFVERQLMERGERLLAAEDALQTYEETEDAVSLDDEARRLARLTAELQTARDQAVVERQMVEAQLASIQSEINKIEPNLSGRVSSAVIEKEISGLHETIANLEVKIETKYAQNPGLRGNEESDRDLPGWLRQVQSLQNEADEKARQYVEKMMAAGGVDPNLGSDRASIPSALAYITQLKRQLVDKNIEKAAIGARVAALTNRLARYENDFELIPGQARQVARLQRELSSSENTYEWLMTRYNEAKILEESEFGFVRVLDHAILPDSPVSPNWIYSLVMAIAGGLLLGLFAAALAEILDDRLRQPADIRHLGLNLAAVIPKFKKDVPEVAAQEFLKALVRIDSKVDAKTILVTGSGQEEGKSFTARELAIASARQGKRTLVMACSSDDKQPDQKGLIDLLQREAKLKDVVQKTSSKNVYSISYGRLSDTESVVVDGKTMNQLVNKLSSLFDRIILDGGSINSLASTLALAKYAESVVLVVRSGQTRVDDLSEAIRSIKQVATSNISVVLNAFDAKEAFGYYSQRGHYGEFGRESAQAKLRRKHVKYVYSKQAKKKKVEKIPVEIARRRSTPKKSPSRKVILPDSIYAPRTLPKPLKDWIDNEWARRDTKRSSGSTSSGDGLDADKVNISVR